jgi:hypothetical protein
LLADTIDFLRNNLTQLEDGFNRVSSPFWYFPDKPEQSYGTRSFGTYLRGHAKDLLMAFEQGILFDWLRGEKEIADSEESLT